MRHARLLRLVGVVLAAALATAGCAGKAGSGGGGTDTNGNPTVKIGGGQASLNYAVPQLADKLGIDKQHGVDIQYVEVGTSSTNMVAGLMSGDFDFAVPATSTAFDAIRQGSDLVIVGGVVRAASILALRKQSLGKLGVDAQAPIEQRMQALKGLTLVTSPEGSGNNTILRGLLKAYGLNPDKDLRIVGVQDTSAIVAGIKQGQFDGGFYGSGVMERNIADGEAALWVSIPRGDVIDKLGDPVGAVVVTKRSLAEKNPELVGKVFDAIAATEKRIVDDPVKFGAELKGVLFPQMNQQVFDLAWEQARHAYPTDGKFTKANFDTMLSQLRSTGNDYSRLNYDRIVFAKAKG